MNLKICLISIISFICILPSFNFAQDRYLQEAEDLREEIQIINLVNSLDLRKEQIEFIIERASRTENIHCNTNDKISEYKSELLGAFSEIKKEVESGRVTVERGKAKEFREVKNKIENIVKDAQIQIEAMAKEVEAKLEPFQLITLDSYKPCVIPQITNNNRIGQSDTSIGMVRVLEQVKGASELRYAKMERKLIDRILERIKRAPLNFKIDETEITTQILNTFKEVRNMDDVDFQIKKYSVASELHNKIFPERILITRTDKIKKFLLSKNTVQILEKKLSKLL